jgi:uncharacterized protein (DUF1330 family)
MPERYQIFELGPMQQWGDYVGGLSPQMQAPVGLQVKDAKGCQTYREAMVPILLRDGGGFRYDFEVSKVLKPAEATMNRVFVIFFPDRSAKDAFFSDPAYLTVRQQFFKPSVESLSVIAEYEYASPGTRPE